MVEVIARSRGRGWFSAVVNGEVLVLSTATPLFAAARVLSKRGVDDDTELVLKHFGSDIVSIRSTVGACKELTVVDPAREGPFFRKFTPFGDSGAKGEDDGA